jgi:hypothetical protein
MAEKRQLYNLIIIYLLCDRTLLGNGIANKGRESNQKEEIIAN